MSTFKAVEFHHVNCGCPGRSWSFPATVTVVVDDDTFAAHWQDGVGFTPCVVNEEGYRRMYAIVLELEGEMPLLFEDWQMMAAGAVAEANEKPFEHWNGEYQAWLKRRMLDAINHQARAGEKARQAAERTNLALCRVTVASLTDEKLRAAANRLLAGSDWMGDPHQLVEAAKAVLAP